jgi:transcription elongation factor GreA
MPDTLPITERAKKMLEKELKHLLGVERAQNIKDIENARSNGDLSENADYDAAKERQALIEARVQEIQKRLAGAQVIDPAKLKSEKVIFGAHVTLYDLDSEKEVTYQIVGPEEADAKEGRISILSPLARSLVGKGEGETVEVQNPSNIREYEISKIFFQ